VRWGGTLRAYGLGAALLVIALALFARALARPARRTRLAAAVVAVLAVQCLFQSVSLLTAIGAGAVVAAVAARQWAGLVAPLAAGLAAVASLLPYLGPVGRVGEWSMLLQGPLGLTDIAAKLVAMLSASGTVAALGWGTAWALGVATALHRRADPAALYVGTVTVVAPIAFTLFLLRLGYKTEPWYYVGLAVLVAVSAEAALWAARPPRWARWARLGIAAVVVAACLPAAWAALGERQTNVDVIAARLSTEARAGDVIVISPWFYALPFDRSYRGVAEVLTVPPLEDRRLHRYDLFKRRMLDPRCMAPVLESVEAALRRGNRVWIVGSVLTSRGQRPPVPPPPPLPGTGWNAGPYLASWMKQLGAVVERRARDVRPVIVPKGVVESESAALLVASGHVP
jgi:hypothetical protein